MSSMLRRWFPHAPQIIALWLSFFAYSLIRAPIPAVNEPHYLVKARNYWQPDWCAGDLFLESANPHLVFYQTIGTLTAFASLETAALIGRGVALLLLAIGWVRLVSHFLAGRWAPLSVAWLFLLLQSAGNFAGEWLVGGVESKVIAYALVMWGCAALLDRRLKTGGALIGAAVSFHPVVGAWCVLGLAGAALLLAIRPKASPTIPTDVSAGRIMIRQLAPALACAALCSLPGLIPAAALLSHPDPAAALRADIIQVAIRLDHHLDPYMFPWRAYAWYSTMIVLWLIIRWRVRSEGAARWLDAFTWIALAIAAIGWLAAAGPRPLTQLPLLTWRIKLLKLYPFRIADLVVPFTLAVTVVRWLSLPIAGAISLRRGSLAAIGYAAAFGMALLWPGVDRNPSRMRPQVREDWIASLRWIRTETPRDVLLWMPDEDWAVKWFAERPEYVNFKDCPQDTVGIIEWYERRVRLAEWKRDSAADGHFSGDELARLHEQTGITHIVASRMGPVDFEPAFANESFRVYDIR